MDSALRLAIDGADFDFVRELIKKGANVSQVNSDGYGLLQETASNHDCGWRMAELLIQSGANVNQNVIGWTPLHSAIQYQNLQVMCTLICYGADINIRDNDGGETPFEMMSRLAFENPDEMQDLLEYMIWYVQGRHPC